MLAKELLKEWLAAGKLPWSCMLWKGLDAEGIARLEHAKTGGDRPSTSSHRLRTTKVTLSSGAPMLVFWEENGAREQATCGARALGIKVSRKHLVALLPDKSRESEEVRGAGEWIAAEAKRMQEANEVPRHHDHRLCTRPRASNAGSRGHGRVSACGRVALHIKNKGRAGPLAG